MFHIVLAAVYGFKLWDSFGSFTLFLFFVVFSCWIAALTYVLFVCHGTLVRLT